MYILRGHRSKFPNYDVLTSLKVVITITIIADPDEMPHFAVCQSKLLGFFSKAGSFYILCIERH